MQLSLTPGCLEDERGVVAQLGRDASALRPFEVALRRARQREDSHNADTLYFPVSYDREMNVTLAENVHHGVDRLKICASDSLSASTFESTIWRDVATTGATVRVVYLVSHLGLIKSTLNERIRLDRDSGVQVRVVAAHALPEQIAELQLGETLIVDGRIAAYRNLAHGASTDESGPWTISVSADHVGQFASTFSDIWEMAADPESVPERLDLEEPLVQSAPVIAAVAPVLCQGDHIDKHECDWYHGSWQFLRLMGLVSTPAWHHDFYSNALSSAVSGGARHILVTGTADYSVLAYVLHAIQGISAATVTVIDLCNTPLFACQWYAKRCGFHHLTLLSDDVLTYLSSTSERYDLVITDAFLTRFDKANANAVVDGWSKILMPQGRVITTVRVHSESESGQTAEEAIASFRERARIRWRRWAPFIDLRAVEVADRAEIYARRMISRPIGTQSEINDLLSKRFSVCYEELAQVPGELFPTKYIRTVSRKLED
jgi:hypothetical protein